ncbi:hypothetical protein [Solimonas marina]|uniref:Serine acetyltransferase n=1 Tax=Solimonas marina TaxID=2714601 RepID=A0A970B426_9GAMM|nr:hypothetical protein [Solimonas marina]NKF21892.1 hypothetical protein [Solimonas marina]
MTSTASLSGNPVSKFISAMRLKGFHARIILSILYGEKVFPISFPFKILRKLINQAIYHCEIHPDSFISSDAILTLRLPHPFLIIVHRKVQIGRNVTLFHNVTLGNREHGHSGYPIVEDNAYVGTGAVILGAVTLGHSATVGAMALVLSDVNPGQRAVGLHRR